MVKTKKILSLVLTLIMLFSVMPMTDLGVEASAVCYEHNFVNYVDNAIMKSQATCTKKAVYYKTCENCWLSAKNIDESQTFEYGEPHAKPTTPDGVRKPYQDEYLLLNATCMDDALYSYVCARCYEPMIPDGTNILDPSVTIRLGIEVYIKEGTATNPGHFDVTKLKKLEDEVKATCTQNGKTAKYKCNEAGCGLVFGGEKIAPFGHKFNYATIKDYKAPTCLQAGHYGEKYCDICKQTLYYDEAGREVKLDYTLAHSLSALGHIDNNVDYICDRCYAMLEASEPEEPEYKIENGYYYIVNNGTATVLGIDFKTKGKIVIPSTLGGYSVTAIDDYAFSECYWVTDVVIPGTVKTIGEGAFCYCIALKEIVIPENVTSIGDYAFGCCISLEKLIVKNRNTTIGNYIGFSDAIVKAGHTAEEWVNKYYAILDAELNGGGASDSMYDDIIRITDIYDDIVANPYLTIYGYEPSSAKTFATANKINFKNISEYLKKDVDKATGVEVAYPEVAFNTDVEFVVREDGTNANIALGGLFMKYKSYDISFISNGSEVQPNGKVTVKLPVPDGYSANFVAVYYINAFGVKTRLDSKIENGYVIFETDHFSEYVVVDESSKIESPAEPDEPDTPDTPTEPCTCKCHGNFIQRLIFKITNFFAKLFNPAKKICACGVAH